MFRFAASWTMNFTSSMCPGDRYGGSPGDLCPDARLKTNIPFADMRSKSAVIRCLSATVGHARRLSQPVEGSDPLLVRWDGRGCHRRTQAADYG